MSTKAQLKRELQTALNQVRYQEQAVLDSCAEDGMDPYTTRQPSGEFILAPFITAKAQLMCALVSLENTR